MRKRWKWRYHNWLLCASFFFFRQEKEGLLTEAIKSFKGALGLDEKLQSAKEHVEKIQRQIKLMEEVGSVLLLLRFIGS